MPGKTTWTEQARAIYVDASGLAIVNGANVQRALEELDSYISELELTGGSGSPGADGESAYQVWLDAGNVGTEADFLASLVGPAGADGADGADGGIELAYSENGTNVVTGPVSPNGNQQYGVGIAIPNTDIIVPPSNGRPVYLDAWSLVQQIALGTGQAVLEIWETTTAAALVSRSQGFVLPNLNAANASRNLGVYHPPMRIGVVAAQRSFQLRINAFAFTATLPSVQAANTNAIGFKTWLRAVMG